MIDDEDNDMDELDEPETEGTEDDTVEFEEEDPSSPNTG